MENEFLVHSAILAYASATLRVFLNQPQNENKKNNGQKMTLELPPNVNNKVASVC